MTKQNIKSLDFFQLEVLFYYQSYLFKKYFFITQNLICIFSFSGLSVSREIIIAVVLAAAAFILLSLFAAYAGYAKLVQIKQGIYIIHLYISMGYS